MPTTTPVNGWPVPVSTDLVKDGAVAIEALGDAIDASANKTWQAWTTFTPSFSGITLGTGAIHNSSYVLVGKTLHIRVNLTLGTGGSMGAGPFMTLPASLSSKGITSANMWMVDAGAQFYTGVALASTTLIVFYVNNATGTYGIVNGLGPSVPFAWGVNDNLNFTMSFEVF
jgi:hypothetical protein